MPKTQHRIFPSVVSGYELSPEYGWFSILEPYEMKNLVMNPSFETNEVNSTDTTYYVGNNSTLAVSSDYSRRGAYSLSVEPTAPYSVADGVDYDIPVSELDDGQPYIFSCDILGKKGYAYEIYALNSLGAIVARSGEFISNGRWMRKSIKFLYDEDVPNTETIRVARTRVQDGNLFYIDGVMIINDVVESTYFDGDSLSYAIGDSGYKWMGAAHKSISRRSGTELSSGRVRNLNDYGYHVLGFSGLGLIPQEKTINKVPLVGGGKFQRGIDEMREYSIVGSMARSNLKDMMINRARIENLLRNSHTFQQPLSVYMQMIDDCGNAYSDPLILRSLYDGGFEQTVDNLNQERSAMQFTMDRPQLMVDGDEGDTLDTFTELGITSGLVDNLLRKDGCTWDNWGGAASGAVWTLRYDPSTNRVYMGGNFTTLEGGATVFNRFCYWDVEAQEFTGLDYTSGANDDVLTIEIAGTGDVYVGGEFTNFEGILTSYLVMYSFVDDTWHDTFGFNTAGVLDMAFAPDGKTLYFITSTTVYETLTDCDPGESPSVTQISTGITGNLYCIAVSPDGTVYVGGNFTVLDGTNANNIAYYDPDGPAWVAMGTGMLNAPPDGNEEVRNILFGDDGNMYVAGTFEEANGVSAVNIAMYNGQSFFPLGNGIQAYQSTDGLRWHDGKLYVLIYGSAGERYPFDRTSAEGFATWNGTSWMHIDAKSETTGFLTAIDFDKLGNIYIGGHNFDGAQASACTIVENTGTANARPVIEIVGEEVEDTEGAYNDLWRILWIKNESTDRTIFLDLPINCEEIITIDFRYNRNTITSNVRGNMNNAILPGSEMADFYLAPGYNAITVFTPAGYLKSRIWWQIPHDYMSGAVHG